MTTDALLIPTAERMFEKVANSRWTPRAINLAALLLLTYSLAQWTWRLLAPPPAPPATTALPTASGRETALHNLLASNLFGQFVPNGASQNLPMTSLNLVLTGVMVQGKYSFALISVNGAPEISVGVGEDVTGGVRLHAVYPDRVVLRRGAALENLPLKEPENTLAPGSITTAPGALPPGAIRSEGHNSFMVERDAITHQMQTPDFLTQASVVPNASGGFLVREIQPGSVYEKLGLRAGDVIHSINGQPVNTMDEVMRIYQQLGGVQKAGRISVDVTRNGRTETLQYQLQ